ncbi:MAG: hypothetical protein LBU31_01540 [Coriobacteriales bacterium]|jgi:hypothetical protein|nr:hypothetical protein [Coriobacteriales bacterium]
MGHNISTVKIRYISEKLITHKESKKKILIGRTASCLFVSILLLLLFATLAFAGYAYGAYTNASSQAGVNYQSRNYVYTSPSNATAYTTIASTNATQASGYLGCQAWLLTDEGYAVGHSGWAYNSSSFQINHAWMVSYQKTGASGGYCSWGYARYWEPANGGYSTMMPGKSPSQNA